MRYGNWVPIDKSLVQKLPTNRPLSEVEAMLSLTVDYDNAVGVSVAGMAARWGWNRKTVMRFLEKIGVEVHYPEETSKRQNQKGQIRVQIRDRSKKKEGQIRFIDSKDIEQSRGRSKEKEGQIRDRSRDTTIYPNPKPKKNTLHSAECSKVNGQDFYITKKWKKLTGEKLESFNRFWTAFSYKLNKAEAADAWLKVYSPEIEDRILSGAQLEADRRPGILAAGRIPKMAEGWLTGRRWENEQLSDTSHDCNTCRYNQDEPCANLSQPSFDPSRCDAYQPVQRLK
jgi:hypothetical protein